MRIPSPMTRPMHLSSFHSRVPLVIPRVLSVIPACPSVIPADAGTQSHKNNRSLAPLAHPGPLSRKRRALLFPGFPRPRE